LRINEIKDFLKTGRASERIKSFCRAMLGALWLSGKRLRVNTFAQKIGERIDESLPTALSVLVVRAVATFHITSYLNVSDRAAVVQATMELWTTNAAASHDSTTAVAFVSTADTSEPPPALRQALESADSAVGLTGAVDDDDARLASERKSTASARRNAEAAPAAGAVGAAAIDSAAVDNARTTITRKSARLQSVQAAEAAKVKAAVPTPTAAFAPAHNKRVGKKNAAIIVQLEKKGVNSPVSNRTRSRTPATLATSALPPVSATPTLPATALPTAAPPTAPPVSPSVTSTLPPPTPTAPSTAPIAPSTSSSTSPQRCVVLKFIGTGNSARVAIKREREMRGELVAANGGVLIDGIVPIMDLPMPPDAPFIVMAHLGVDLAQVDLTDGVTRNAVVRAFPAFESMLARIHAAGWVVFDLWPRNILVQRDGSVVKLWLIDLESMLREGARCADTPQLRLDDLKSQTAEFADDLKRWDRVKLFVELKGLVPFGELPFAPN
jgi:hypothetical protein